MTDYIMDGEDSLRKELYNLSCIKCKHYHRDVSNTCDAFPDGIPIKFLQDNLDHREPYKGDHGIQFEDKNINV
ncbi:MAG: hypothetical protein U9N38_05050 [Thermodesulfobacteriota bacterium]|nr:hypothetical protein [Thermodesulfobacteriota bacterium]